jgi:hypothetical protein
VQNEKHKTNAKPKTQRIAVSTKFLVDKFAHAQTEKCRVRAEVPFVTIKNMKTKANTAKTKLNRKDENEPLLAG